MTDEECPRLPSNETACLVAQTGTIPWSRVLRDVAGRTAVAAIGMALFGPKMNTRKLLRSSLASAIGIEIAVLWHASSR